MLSEGASRQDFCEHLLKAIDSAYHEQFRHTMLKLQDDHDEGTIVTSCSIIIKATTKFNSLVGHKCLPSTDSSKCSLFINSETTTSGSEEGWNYYCRMTKIDIPSRHTVERYGKVWHWCPNHVQLAHVFPNGLWAFSNRPETHD